MRHIHISIRSRRALGALLATLGAILTATTVTSSSGTTITTTTSLPSPQPVVLKPVLAGLIDRHKPSDQAWRGTVDAYVVEVAWADLQAAPAAPLPQYSVIDQAIAQAKISGLKLKLRVLAGTSTPEWAKRLDGPPVPVIDEYGNTGTIGRFWTSRFAGVYRDLQQQLAARYDTIPQIVMTQITRCTTMYAEPFLRQGRTPQSVQSLLNAGYTASADEACQAQQVDVHRVWKHTRSGLSFNPYQRIAADGSVTNDVDYATQMMGYCRSVLGARCMLENHSIRSTSQGPSYDKLYAAMRGYGGPIGFQTAAPDRIGDLQATLVWAVSQGAAHVELPISYRTDATPATLLSYNWQLNNNILAAAATCS